MIHPLVLMITPGLDHIRSGPRRFMPIPMAEQAVDIVKYLFQTDMNRGSYVVIEKSHNFNSCVYDCIQKTEAKVNLNGAGSVMEPLPEFTLFTG